MKKNIGILLFLFGEMAFAQFVPTRFWIQFTDKANTPYAIGNPSEYLSQRAIDRRTSQSIEIRENDLPVDTAYINAVLRTGVTLLNRSKWFNAITVSTPDTDLINTIKTFPFVAGTKPVGIIKGKSKESVEPLPYLKTGQVARSTSFDYGISFNQLDMLGGSCLHDYGYRGQGMQIAVIDAGFTGADTLPAFDSLHAGNSVLGQWNFVTGDSVVYKYDFHGTAVLSTMAANLPGSLIGTAPLSKYYLLVSEQGGGEYSIEEDNWVSAAEYADSAGADVINTSLGYNTFNDDSRNYTYADMNGNTAHITIGADMAVSKGMIVVSGAGNEGNGSWKYIIPPADADSVIAVGAVDANRNYVSFSSVGPTSDGRVKPDVAAQGAGTIITSSFGGVQGGNGTSFAAPVIAGMITCLWQANPEKRNTEITDAVKQSASLYNNPGGLLGYGIPNFCIANSLLKGADPAVFQEDSLISLTQHPFGNAIEGIFYAAKTQNLRLELLDIAGRTVYKEEKKAWGNNYNNFKLSRLEFLSAGVYILTIAGDNKGYKYKMLKAYP